MVVTRSMSRNARFTDQEINQRRHALWMRMINTRTMGFVRRMWPRQYKPTDASKRHRIRDTQPRTERVASYTRRI